MSVKFSDIVNKVDVVKISILLIIAAILWVWVWTEMKKPILPENFDQDYFHIEEL